MQGKHVTAMNPTGLVLSVSCIWFPLCFLSNVSDQFFTLRNSLMQWSVFLGPTSASSFGTISNKLAPARIIL